MLDTVTGERFDQYLRLVRMLAYFPIAADQWPEGGKKEFFQACYEFALANGYQRKDFVEKLFVSLSDEFIAQYAHDDSDHGKPDTELVSYLKRYNHKAQVRKHYRAQRDIRKIEREQSEASPQDEGDTPKG